MLGVTSRSRAGSAAAASWSSRRATAVTTIDGRETAPGGHAPDSFWENGAPLPFNGARWSGLSGRRARTVATWDDALSNYGTMARWRGARAGIDVARDGFVVDQTFFDHTQENVDLFDDIPVHGALYLDPDGTPRDVGTVLRNPDLARAYERIAHLGAKGFYRGAIADAIVEAVQHPVVAPTPNHVWRPGVDDHAGRERLRRARAPADARRLPRPRRLRHGAALERRLDRRRGAEHPRGLRPRRRCRATQAFHYFLEASRYSFADRNAYLADPDYFDVPLSGCSRTATRPNAAALIDPMHGHEPQSAPAIPRPYTTARRTRAGFGDEPGRRSTTHLTTSDRWGNVVAYTFTIESTGGAASSCQAGFLLNNELTDFNFDSTDAPEPGRGRQAAAQLDGARRSSSTTSEPLLALGSPGGSTIITTVLQILSTGSTWARRCPGDRRSAREPAQRDDHTAQSRRPS